MGPGMTVIDGYRGALNFQNQQRAQQLSQAVTGLGLAEKIRQAQQAAARERAIQEANGDLGAIEGALMQAGDLQGAERAGRMRRERDYEREVSGAIGPDGQPDWNRIAAASVRFGNSAGALNAAMRADQAAQRRTQDDQDRGALRFLLGDPAPDGPPGQLPATGELPQEGMRPNAPAGRPGALAEYLNSPNPAVRRQAAMIRDLVSAGALPAREAARQLGALAGADVRTNVVATQEEGRDSRAERRMSEIHSWDSKRGVGITRGGEAVLPDNLPGLPAGTGGSGGGRAGEEPKAMQTMRWRIKTLIESGLPLEDAQRIVAGGASLQINPGTKARLAAQLMKVTNADMSPMYPTLGAAMQAVEEAIGANTARSAALPPAPDAMPGSLSQGATSPGRAPPSVDAARPAAPAPRRLRFNERGEPIQ